MKRWVRIFISLSLLVCAVFLYKQFYEPFPVKSVSKKEVLMIVDQSNGRIVRIPSNHQGYQWYISTKEKAHENLIHLMKVKRWDFVKKDGNYYLFVGVQGNISVHSEIWSETYIIFNFPEGI